MANKAQAQEIIDEIENGGGGGGGTWGSITGTLSEQTDLQVALNAKISTTQKGVANGVAELDVGGKVPAAQLPSYVDDVLEYANLAALPGTGEVGKIYVTLDTNKCYRWTGSIYVEISNGGVADAITDGVTDVAPSQNAVFDALAGKLSSAANAVANSNLAQMAANTLKGNNTGGASDPLDLTATQATAILNAVVGDSGSGGTKGLVPAPGAGDTAATKFLKANGSWEIIPSILQTERWYVDAVAGNNGTADGTISRPYQTIQAALNAIGVPQSKQDACKHIEVYISNSHSSVQGTNAVADSNFDGVYVEGSTSAPLWVPPRVITFYGNGIKIGNTNGASGYGNIIQEVSTARRFGANSAELRHTMTFVGTTNPRDSQQRIRNSFHIGGDLRIKPLVRTIASIQGDASGPNDRVTITINGGQNQWDPSVSPGSYKAVTLDGSTDRVTLASHGLSNSSGSQRVFFKDLTGITGLSIDTPYCIVNATGNDFQLALTVGGAVIDFSGTGSGTLMSTPTVVPWEDLVRISVSGTTNYNTAYDIIEKISSTSFIAKRTSGTNTSSALETSVGSFYETDSTGGSAQITQDIAFINAYMQGRLSKDDGTNNGSSQNAGALVVFAKDSRFFSGMSCASATLQRLENCTIVWTANSGSVLSFSRTSNVVTVNTTATLTWAVGDIVTMATTTSGAQNIDGTFLVVSGGTGTFTVAQTGTDYGSQTPSGAATISCGSRISTIASMRNSSLSGRLITSTFTYGTDDTGWLSNRWQSGSILHTTATGAPISNFRMDSVTMQSMIQNSVNMSFPVTFQDTGDTVTLTAHGLPNGTPIQFPQIVTTTGISVNTTYYVLNAAANTFQLASSASGSAALPLTTNGTGIMHVAAEYCMAKQTSLVSDKSIKNNANTTVLGNSVYDALNTLGQGAAALFKQTSTVTVANTITETALTGTGVGSLTLPAHFFIAGRTLKIRGMGYNSSTTSPTIRIRVKIGSTVVCDTTAVTSNNETNGLMEYSAMITCRTVGSSGTVFAQGFFHQFGATDSMKQMVNTTTATIDTTLAQAVSVTVEWGAADPGNSISQTNFEMLG